MSTSTAGFVGPTRFGPIDGEPELLTSFADFERIYGGLERLDYSGRMHNYVAHAVRSFFEEGGRRIYVARVYKPSDAGDWSGYASVDIGDIVEPADPVDPEETESPPAKGVTIRARYPGGRRQRHPDLSV